MRNQKRRATQMFALIAVLFAVTAWFVFRSYGQAPVAKAAASAANPLIGMWEMTVVGSSGTYRYKYAVSDGAWVAIGNIDEGFLNYHYSPTIGAYVKNADGSYS